MALNRVVSRACAEGVRRCREGSALRGMLGSSGGVIREAGRHACALCHPVRECSAQGGAEVVLKMLPWRLGVHALGCVRCARALGVLGACTSHSVKRRRAVQSASGPPKPGAATLVGVNRVGYEQGQNVYQEAGSRRGWAKSDN